MNAPISPSRLSWSARLLIGLTLIILGAAAAIWALAHYQGAARFLGVAQPTPAAVVTPQRISLREWRGSPEGPDLDTLDRVAEEPLP